MSEPRIEQAEPSLLRQALTLPNILSLLRLAGVPVFVWLVLGPRADGWALVLLVFSALTDWLDGKLARWLGQQSRLGRLLDPSADRLYILATLLALSLRGVLPWWFTIALLAREAMLLVCLGLLRRAGYGPPPVHYLGKTATFILLFAFPVLLLAHASATNAGWAGPVGWALAWWGLGLYWIAGFFYVIQVAGVLRGTGDPARPAAPA